jgi:VanZ family protein
VSFAVILAAPFALEIRAAIRSAFPTQFENILAAIVGAAVAVAGLVAVARIRDQRALRYGALITAVALGAAYARAVSTGNAEVDAVERFHFVEYGLIGLLFYRAWHPLDDASVLVLPVLSGLLAGVADEWLQWFIPARVGEVHDVFLNGAALACGVMFGVGLEPPERLGVSLRPGSLAWLGSFVGLVILLVAGFVDVVHIGHRVRLDDAASFESRYAEPSLRRLTADRAERWQSRPPPPHVARLSREDQYLSEGLWHVQRRNRAWDAGDLETAWWENRILEEHFAPVLDAPSSAAPAGHRWPAEQRADAAGRRPANPAPYESDAAPYPLYFWPRSLFRLLAGLAGVGTAIMSVALDRARDRTI